MKRILFLGLVNLLLFQFAFSQHSEMQINGKIPEINQGKILLLVQGANKQDTIACADIHEGEFLLKANLGEACVANLVVGGYGGGFVMIAEPEGQYEVLLTSDNAEFLKAEHLQNALAKYQSIVSENNAEIATLRKKIEEANKEKRFKTKSDLNKELTRILDNAQSNLDEIIGNNRGTVLSAYLLTNGLALMSAEAMETNFAKLNEAEKRSQPGKIYKSMIAELRKIDINSIAPDFTLPDMDGNKHSLHALEGKLKLVDFWASWCGPCRKENPNMISIYNDFKDKGLLVVGVSLDDNRNSWIKAVEADGLKWLQLSALSGYNDDVVKRYNIDAIPTIYILDANNKIVAKNLRGDKLREFVANYLENIDTK